MKKYKCTRCGKEFERRHSLIGHISSHFRGAQYAKSRETVRSKKKKETKLKKICKYCNKEFENGWQLGGHQTACKLNPNYSNWLEKIIIANKNRKTSDKTKEKISESMKLAHKEGRAWNIGMSRWNNKPSYPEQFFIKVIENEFNDKNYIREHAFNRYSLDFAWPEKKRCIEIDGQQHERFDEYKIRDKAKDKLLNKENWQVLRIKWKDMYNDSKKYIKLAKEFIDN